jgi:hypothetical protein
MGKKYSIFFVLIIFFSCQKAAEKPENILSHDQMVAVLAEVYIAEEKISHMGLTADSSLVVFNRVQGRIFEATGVADSVFKKSFDYYMTRPKELERIYTVLIDSLQLREQRSGKL